MAIADALMVDTGLLRLWIAFQFDIDVRTFSSFGCQLHIMLTYYAHQVGRLRRKLSYYPWGYLSFN